MALSACAIVRFVGLLPACLLAGDAVGAEDQPLKTFRAEPWNGQHVNDLHNEYYNIFKYGNRNAASHLWSKFLLDRADQMTHERFTYMFSGFCAVSGSPVSPQDRNRYRYNLTMAGGGFHRGYMHHCCSPCVCDSQDFVRVDTKTITLLDGKTRQYHFAVLGNPCDHPEALSKPFVSPFDGQEYTIKQQAAEVRCDASGNLEGAYLSDHGNIIIGMFLDEDPSYAERQRFVDESVFAQQCKSRAEAGYNSGMGEIFRKVAEISPVKNVVLAVDAKSNVEAKASISSVKLTPVTKAPQTDASSSTASSTTASASASASAASSATKNPLAAAISASSATGTSLAASSMMGLVLIAFLKTVSA